MECDGIREILKAERPEDSEES